MENQFMYSSIQFGGAAKHATDVSFDAGGDETASSVKAYRTEDQRPFAHLAADGDSGCVVVRGALMFRMPRIQSSAPGPDGPEPLDRDVNHTGVDFRRWFFLRSSRSSCWSSLIRVTYCDTGASFAKGRLD